MITLIHFSFKYKKIQENQLVGYQMTNDYKCKNYTASVTTVNNDIVQNSGIWIIIILKNLYLKKKKFIITRNHFVSLFTQNNKKFRYGYRIIISIWS